ncbi:MAG: hypothetical protein QOE63_1345, partial [Acidimicrobiaceae bacterium]
MALTIDASASPATFRTALVRWIDDHLEELQPRYTDHGSTEQLLAHL